MDDFCSQANLHLYSKAYWKRGEKLKRDQIGQNKLNNLRECVTNQTADRGQFTRSNAATARPLILVRPAEI